MSQLTIGEVARQAGLQTSAIRYYESEGLLPKPVRQNGRRVYNASILQQLALISIARNAGFSINDLQTLITGFATDTPASVRWRQLATAKLSDIRTQIERLQAMTQLLENLLSCECPTLEDCGRLAMGTADA